MQEAKPGLDAHGLVIDSRARTSAGAQLIRAEGNAQCVDRRMFVCTVKVDAG